MLFAGLTVAISVTGLAFFGLDFVTKLGIGSALGVLTTVLIANSLLIAVLAKLGHKVDRLKVPFLKPLDDSEAARERTLIARWGRFVTAHASRSSSSCWSPALALAATSALVRLGASDQGHAADQADGAPRVRPPGRGLRAGLQRPDPDRRRRQRRRQAPQRVYDGVRDLDGVASVGEPQFNDEKTVAIVFVTPDLGAAGRGDRAARRPPARRRRARGDGGGNAVAYVSGLNAAFMDIADRIMERLPLFLLYIIGVTFIVLAMAFRSIVISLTAAVTTILSAFIGFGVLTLVIQEGHLMASPGSTRRARSRRSCRRSPSRSCSASRWTTWSS